MNIAILLPALIPLTGAYAQTESTLPVHPEPANGSPASASNNDLPPWLIGFTNISEAQRVKYLMLFQQAKEAFFQKKWFSCMEKLEEAEEIYKGNPHISTLRGSCYMELGNYDGAMAEYVKVTEILPDDPSNKANIATLLMLQQKYTESLALFKKLLESLPHNTDNELKNVLKFKIYICLLRTGQNEEADRYFQEADILEDSPRFYFMEAIRYLHDKKTSQGLQSIRSAERIFGTTPIFQTYLAILEQMKFLP